MQKDDGIFEKYKDLYELTKKTVDEHIEFYKMKESLSASELFEIWKKLSKQSENLIKGTGQKTGITGTRIFMPLKSTNMKQNF